MKRITIVGCGLLLMFSAIQVEAVSTLHIGPGYGDPCATGCGGDPNLISPFGLDIYQNSGGATTLTSLLLILALPNNVGTVGSISGLTSYNPYAGGSPVSYSTPVSAVSAGTMGPGGELYSFLGLPSPHDNSNSFVNFAATENSFGITATSFGIYKFSLDSISLGPKGLLDVDFSSGLPDGTIAAAFGTVNGTNYDTPYTEAGAVGPPVPEPSTLLLLGSGLLGLGGFAWRRNRKG